jgi:hypothetical protein
MIEQKRMRVSYTLLNLWSKGKTDEAIQAYFHIERDFIPKAMKMGKDIHQEIADFVNAEKKLPPFLPKLPLVNPQTEHRIVVKYNELFDLSGVIDLLDEPILYEFKTGVNDSLVWSSEDQIPFYFLLAEIQEIEIEKGYLVHFNQYNRTCDFTQVWNGKQMRERARNLIDSIGPEIHDYFVREGLI